MAIRAVVFDIGGVLEITPDLGVMREWENRLGLPAGGLEERMRDAWAGGSIGTITENDVHQAARERLGLDEPQLAAFMADLWREYLGTPNTELIDDTEMCVAGARDAGLHPVLHLDNAQTIAEIETLLTGS